MEAFSLLKYWRGGGGSVVGVGDHVGVSSAASNTSKPITATLDPDTDDDENDEEEENGDDGPFFDLEFSVNDDEEEEGNDEDAEEACNDKTQKEEEDDDDEVEEREFKFTLSSGSSSNDCSDIITDQNLSLSPSDDLFFKGKLVPVESTTTFASHIIQSNSHESKPVAQFPVSLMKSATKFRVFMLGLNKKSKANNVINSATDEKLSEIKEENSKNRKQPRQQGKFFTVKFKVEEVPIVSLFTRDNSSRVSNSSSKQNSDNDSSSSSSSNSSTTEEKRFAKEVMQRYLKMVKPLYVRVSRKYGEKLRLSGRISLTGPISKSSSPAQEMTAEKSSEPEVVVSEAPASNNGRSLKAQVNLPAGLRVVRKHLGKSRSASSAAVTVAEPPAPGTALSRRRDDSLLQQQDGIQSAILHCKRSFNSLRGLDSEASLLSRSASDPSRKLPEVARF